MNAEVVLSRWVNERCPPLTEILTARDVARLTRRPCWLLLGLSLIGHFPRRAVYRGRPVGWCRSEVIAWMSRDLALEPDCRKTQHRVRHRPHQQRLPLRCRARRHIH
jgi:predicted DNA-binding transcriptional regulator AlpA